MGSGMLPAGAYVTLEHEHILIFRKSGKREFKNATEKQLRRESAYFWEERNQWFSDIWIDLKGAPQQLDSSNVRRKSAAFPFELPYRLINMFSIKGDCVVDPFLGTGTTMFAAMASCRNSINVEMDHGFNGIIESEIPAIKDLANERIANRLVKHNQFIAEKLKKREEVKHNNHSYGFPVITNQEKHIIFDPVKSITQHDHTTYTVEYTDTPPELFADEWVR